MKDIKTVLIAGAGAIGSMAAYQFFRKDPSSVSVLAGGERLARYRDRGFEINGEICRFPLTDCASKSSPDLVIIACKFHHLAQVLTDLKNHVSEGTVIVSLLNGISSETVIARSFPNNPIPYAMIIGTDAGHEENRTRFSRTGTVYFGGGATASTDETAIASVASLFDKKGIAYTVPKDMPNRLWFKFMMNVGLNQVTAVLRRPYRILKKDTLVREASWLFEAAMREVILVAAAEGIILTEEDIRTTYRTIDTLADDGKTSMCQDVEAGRKTEVELFSGTMIELGEKHGIPVPVNDLLFKMLKAIEKSY